MKSEPSSSSLFWRVFFTRTGIHFARKRSKDTGLLARRQDRKMDRSQQLKNAACV